MESFKQASEPLEYLNEDDVDPFLRVQNGSTELYLIRHGDALPSADEVVTGNYDDQPLSALGRRQALALATRMLQISPVVIYSSPIIRARQTATAMGEALGLHVQIDLELREADLGPVGSQHLANVTRQELPKALRAYLQEIEQTGLSVGIWSRVPGTEPSVALRTRITRAITSIAGRHAGQRVAVVSHTVAINAYIAEVLGLSRDFFFLAANTSISVVRVRRQKHLLLTLNDYAHLCQEGLIGSGFRD